jgi:16S rRNA (cytosine967-C5)-methyltransferase
VIAGARRRAAGGPIVIVQRYFKTRRYAGSKDRRAVRELVFARSAAGRAAGSGRAAMLGLPRTMPSCSTVRPAARPGRRHPIGEERRRAARPRVPGMARSRAVAAGHARRMAGLARARAARPAGQRRAADRDDDAAAFGREPTPLSPWGLRLPPDSRSTTIPPSPKGWSRCRTKAAS